MMNYEDILCHWDERKHKYVAKVKTKNGYYRYFYSKEEYQNYMRDKYKKPIEDFASQRKIDFLSMARKHVKTVNDEGDFKRQHKYIAKIPLHKGKYRYFYSQAEYDSYLRRKEYQENEPDFMKNIPELSDSVTWEESFENINRDRFFDEPIDGKYYDINCMLCTTAYELMQRGYDVSASYMSYDEDRRRFAKPKSLSEIYKNPKFIFSKDATESVKPDIYKFIKDNNPPNARGNLMFDYKGGGGHSVAYETDSKGKVRLIDAQVGEVYNKQSEIDKYSTRVENLILVRTDNLELKEGVFIPIEGNNKKGRH